MQLNSKGPCIPKAEMGPKLLNGHLEEVCKNEAKRVIVLVLILNGIHCGDLRQKRSH